MRSILPALSGRWLEAIFLHPPLVLIPENHGGRHDPEADRSALALF